MTKQTFPDDVRQRVLAVLRDQSRSYTWLARLIHKSKSWGSAFANGRGLISHSEMDVVARATGKSVAYYWTGVDDESVSSSNLVALSPPPSADADPLGGLRYLWDSVPPEQRPIALLALVHALEPFVGGLYARTSPRR